MKPHLSYAEFQASRDPWLMAFERIKVLPQKSPLHARGQDFKLDYVLDTPHPPSVWLKYRSAGKLKTLGVRKGDPLLLELK